MTVQGLLGPLLGLITGCYVLGLFVPLYYRESDDNKKIRADATKNDPSKPMFWAINASLAFSIVGSLLAFVLAGAVSFSSGDPPEPLPLISLAFPHSPIRNLVLAVQIDRLSAFFALIVSGFSALVAVYSFDALKAPHFQAHQHWIAAAFNAFVWSTLLVLFAADCLSLLVGLELMSLAFAYLALYKHLRFESEEAVESEPHERHNARLAPQVYLMASHTSTAFLLVAITILGLHAGALDFVTLKSEAVDLDTLTASAVFLLTLAGLGIRVGLVPAHVWVPLVHPNSPTPTHALSLGIAIKVGVYLMFRFFLEFTVPQPWWGYTLLLLAGVTALVNVWYAIASHDLKTALAYHSIENIGIMAAGLGLGLIFLAPGGPDVPWIAGLALAASLYHVLNHALFKGLLSMATGSIENLTGGNGVEFARLGGLIKRYRASSAAFIIGALAISGFPPLNGFISEWLTLQALFEGLGVGSSAVIAVIVCALILLALSFALTAFCFYKMVGLAFLGKPRLSTIERKRDGWKNLKAENRKADHWWQGDSPPAMLAVMGFMALLCLLLGLLPGMILPWLATIINDLGVPAALPYDSATWSGLMSVRLLTIAPLELFPIIAVTALLALAGWHFVSRGPRRQAPQAAAPWNCGTRFNPSTMQYTGAALSELVRRLQRGDSAPAPESLKRQVRPSGGAKAPAAEDEDEKERSEQVILDEWMLMSDSEGNRQQVHEVFRAVYNRVARWLYGGSERFGNAVQNGDIRAYLGYILAAQIGIMLLFLVLYWIEGAGPHG